jgi:hypothetical protein
MTDTPATPRPGSPGPAPQQQGQTPAGGQPQQQGGPPPFRDWAAI